MNIIVIVFTSRSGIRIHYVMMQDSSCAGWHAISIELGSALILIAITIFNFACGHVENRNIYISTRILLDLRFGIILI